MTLDKLLKDFQDAIEQKKSKREVSYYYHKYDDEYKHTPKEDRDFDTYKEMYFQFLDYMNKKKEVKQ